MRVTDGPPRREVSARCRGAQSAPIAPYFNNRLSTCLGESLAYKRHIVTTYLRALFSTYYGLPLREAAARSMALGVHVKRLTENERERKELYHITIINAERTKAKDERRKRREKPNECRFANATRMCVLVGCIGNFLPKNSSNVLNRQP